MPDNYAELFGAMIRAARESAIAASAGPKGASLHRAGQSGEIETVPQNLEYDDEGDVEGGFLRFGGSPGLG